MTSFNPFDNQDFRDEMSKLLDEKLAPMAELKQKVDEHEKTIQRAKGGMVVFNLLWAMLLAGIEWFIHRR
jgi:hypothetical protein